MRRPLHGPLGPPRASAELWAGAPLEREVHPARSDQRCHRIHLGLVVPTIVPSP